MTDIQLEHAAYGTALGDQTSPLTGISMTNAVTLGQRVKFHRLAANLSQQELARRVRISQPRISQIERDNNLGRLPVRTLKDLAEGLGVDIEHLIADDPNYDLTELDGLGVMTSTAAGMPIPSTPLIGRKSAAADIHAMLLQPDVRLVTLTGPGGVGKSLLALQCAQGVKDRYPGGAHVVSLTWCRDTAQIVATIAHAVGVRQRDELPLRSRLVAALRSPARLLLLDNVEQAIYTVSAFVTELLGACPELDLLVTSRAPLKIRGEHEYPVEPLQLPDSRLESTYGNVFASPAVQLFVLRAQAVFPRFAITESNAELIGAICRRLDGLPLAIELAAARTKVLTLGQIYKRLETPLTFLECGQRDLPARQQGLRAAIAWSHDLLSPAERALFRRLSIFAGGFTYDAAEWLMNDPEVAEHLPPMSGDGEFRRQPRKTPIDVGSGLQCLLDQSLITRRNMRDRTHRFDMLETIRSFAAEQLVEHGDATASAEKHLAWCLALAESAEPNWFGPDQLSWIQRLDLERENLTSALSWSMQHGNIDAGIRLAISLTDYWYLSGHLSEGRDWLERALDATPRDPDNSSQCLTRIRLLACVSQLAQPNGDFPIAAERAEESLRLARALNDVPGIARAAALLGNIAIAREDIATAESYHQHALELFRRLNDQPWVIVGLNDLALVALMRGDHGRALNLATEAMHLARAIGDEWGAGIALRFLGDVALSRGGHKLAARCFCESISIGQANASRWGIADCLAAFGSLAISQGKTERAVRFFGAANAIYDVIGLHMPPKLRPDWKRSLREASAQLGAAHFDQAWQSGGRLGIQQAIREALEHGRLTRSGAFT